MFLAAISVEASPLVLYNIFCLFISSNLVLCTFVSCFNCVGSIHFVITFHTLFLENSAFMNNLHFMAFVQLIVLNTLFQSLLPLQTSGTRVLLAYEQVSGDCYVNYCKLRFVDGNSAILACRFSFAIPLFNYFLMITQYSVQNSKFYSFD
jgi:hypothetical protein